MNEKKEWETQPADLATWAMRATEMLRQRDKLLAAASGYRRHSQPVGEYGEAWGRKLDDAVWSARGEV